MRVAVIEGAEIVEDGNSEKPTFSNLATVVAQLTEVASTAVT
jgi:hypothetical protein